MERSSEGSLSSKGFATDKTSTPVTKDGSSLGSHCLFLALSNERWGDADIWLWDPASGSSDAGLLACVSLDMLPDIRERRQE